MAGIAYRTPLGIGDRGLGQSRSTKASPIPGASLDYIADLLPLGPLASWPSVATGAAMVKTFGSPTVMEESGRRFVRCNGDRLAASWATSGPHTVIAVSRFITPGPNNWVHYGIGAGEAYLGSNSTGDNWAANIGGAGNALTPPVAPNNGWHATLLVCDGVNSIMCVDEKEKAIAGVTFARKGFTLAFGAAPTYLTAIDYERLTVLPYAATTDQRRDLIGQMRVENGI